MKIDLCYRYKDTKKGVMKVCRFESIIKARAYFRSLENKENMEYAYIRKFDGWFWHIKERLILPPKNEENK